MSSDEALLRQPHRLPDALTPLVGRAEEAARALELLRASEVRLLTIVGAGGIGKTRLALHAARALAPEADERSPFAHGVAFVPLAAVAPHEPLEDTLATTIAAALGLMISGREPAADQLRAYVRGKSLLLVLDNFEHLASAAPLVAGLLARAPGLKVLATARERLNLSGEHVLVLAGLPYPRGTEEHGAESGWVMPEAPAPVPPSHYPSVELFVQAAAAVAPGVAFDARALAAVARICRLVDGSPLGIELAAAWTRLLSCEEIAAEIERSLDFLEGGARDAPARHRSLRAVFDYSWGQLSDDERRALRGLAVFRGSFTRQAAADVLTDHQVLRTEDTVLREDRAEHAARGTQHAALRTLASLVDKSLLRRAQGGGEATRYELPEVLRQYAAEQLRRAGSAEDAADRHAGHYLVRLAGLRDALRGAEQQRALAEIGADIDQVRAAWRWAVARRDAASIVRGSDSLFHFYDMRSWFREGERAFAAACAALAGSGEERATWARLLARQGWFAFQLGRQQEGRALLAESLETLRALGAREELLFPLNYLGAAHFYLGEYDATERLCREALELAQATGDDYGRAIAYNNLGQMAFERGDYGAARDWCRQSLAIERQIGNSWSMAFSLVTLGKVMSALGEHDEARRLLQESLRIREAMHDLRGVALCLSRLGETAIALGEHAEAHGHFVRALALFREIGNSWGEAATLAHLGRQAAAQGQDAAATRLLQEALRLALGTASAPLAARVMAAMAPLVRRAGE
ncbi:MAG TPA: tetratricopeptide repeat protein, partial [Roseiflexaceae bacterium]|nr:tetratricopeptide repeat protein [Roseiflexaceae bacterium]